MNFLKGYRTVIVAVLTIIAGLTELVGLFDIVFPGSSGLILLLAGIATLILRYITDTPIGVSTEDQTKKPE